MNRININGEEWVRLHDVCDILRMVGEEQYYDNTDKVLRQIASMMFYDEVKAAETEEDKEAAREFPGDFVVAQDLGYKNPNGKRMIFFQEFVKGEGRAIDNGDKAMIFEYKSMAEEVAKKLKGEWKVFCVGKEYGKAQKRLLDAVFGEEKEE